MFNLILSFVSGLSVHDPSVSRFGRPPIDPVVASHWLLSVAPVARPLSAVSSLSWFVLFACIVCALCFAACICVGRCLI